MTTACECGWRLPADGIRGECGSDAPFNLDLVVTVIFACPECGSEFETQLSLVRARKADEPFVEPS